jgi:hypothetical protein
MPNLYLLQVGLAAVVADFGAVQIFVIRSDDQTPRSALLTAKFALMLERFDEVNICTSEMVNHPGGFHVA